MKIKLETSPWENDFSTIQDYIVAAKSYLNIYLDPSNIAPNPGKRAVAKICLSSLWDNCSQRRNMTQTEYVTDVERWYQLLLDDGLEISNTVFINDNMAQVTYKYKIQYVQETFATNIYIMAFTTSNAQLRGYHMLDNSDNLLLTMIQTALFILIMTKILLKQAVC